MGMTESSQVIHRWVRDRKGTQSRRDERDVLSSLTRRRPSKRKSPALKRWAIFGPWDKPTQGHFAQIQFHISPLGPDLLADGIRDAIGLSVDAIAIAAFD
jgi:hypothetical protein